MRYPLLAAISATIVLSATTITLEMPASVAQQLPSPPAICDPLSVYFGSDTSALNAEALVVISEAVRIIGQRQGRAHVTGHAATLDLC